jgi:hypothetical protein
VRKPHLVSFVVGVVVCAASITPTVAFAQPSQVSHAAATKVSAKKLLRVLHVKAEKHASTYARGKFEAWVDADHDGEDTRAEVLRAESLTSVTENRYGTVKTGKWVSRYDGRTYTAASKLDIDHLVPLQEAWVSGASGWSATKRTAYANDLGYAADLIAVSAHANRSKGDREPNAYLPAKLAYRCTYVKNYIAVKFRWKLSVNASEKKALSSDLAKYCSTLLVVKPGKPNIKQLTDAPRGAGDEPAPITTARPTPTPVSTQTSVPTPSPTWSASPSPVPTSAPAPTQTPLPTAAPPQSGTDPDYGTCSNAKAHHAHTPYYRGVDPEYAYYQDRDHDGVVCE